MPNCLSFTVNVEKEIQTIILFKEVVTHGHKNINKLYNLFITNYKQTLQTLHANSDQVINCDSANAMFMI